MYATNPRQFASRSFALAAAALLAAGAAAHGAVFIVDLDDGDSITGGNANGAVWGTIAAGDEINGLRSTKATNDSSLDNLGVTTPHSMTFVAEFTDVGNPLFGLKFQYDLVAAAFTGTPGGPYTPSYLASNVGIGVHPNTLGGCCGGDDQIDATASEVLRVGIANLLVLDDPNNALAGGSLVADGLVGLTIRHEDSGDAIANEAGALYAAGTAILLASWVPNASNFRDYTVFTPTGSVDIVPTAKEATLQGFRIQFSTVAPPAVPAPAALPAGLALLGVASVRRRKRRGA